MSTGNKPKGTQKTEAIIGTAASKLSVAVKSIQDAAQTAAKLEESLTDYNLKVTDLEAKIASLETVYSQKKAEQDFKLQLDYKTSQKQFAEEFLKGNNMIAVVVEEDTKLRTEYEALKREFDTRLGQEIGKAKGIADNDLKNKTALMESEYKAKEAGNIAKIENLTSQLTFANQQVTLWKEALDKEREAGVQRAQAGSVGSINVTGGGK